MVVGSLVGMSAFLDTRLTLGKTLVRNVVLLGDSVFDNAAYINGGPDVRRQVEDLLPSGTTVSLLASDGATVSDVAGQLDRVPHGATHVIISAGGNDALLASGVLQQATRSVGAALLPLSQVADQFEAGFASMLNRAGQLRCRIAVCTIYDPRFVDLDERRIGTAALAILNDRITRQIGSRRGLTVLDLRLVCDDDEDFANPIEPSTLGGAKIARSIAAFVERQPPSAFVIGNVRG